MNESPNGRNITSRDVRFETKALTLSRIFNPTSLLVPHSKKAWIRLSLALLQFWHIPSLHFILNPSILIAKNGWGGYDDYIEYE